MKQIIVLCLFAVCFPSESFCEGIFGLKKGMSIDEIRTLDFGDIKQDPDNPDLYVIYELKKPKDVILAQLFVTPKNGLLKIRFIWSIQTNVYGDGIRQKFDELHDILTKKYSKTRCVTSKVNDAVKIKGFSVIDDIEQDTHGMGQDFGMPEIQ